MRPGEPAEGSSRAGSIPPQAISRRQLSYILRSAETQNFRILFIQLLVFTKKTGKTSFNQIRSSYTIMQGRSQSHGIKKPTLPGLVTLSLSPRVHLHQSGLIPRRVNYLEILEIRH